MKILITENQLEKVIYNYIEKRLNGGWIFKGNPFEMDWYDSEGIRVAVSYNRKHKIFETGGSFRDKIIEFFTLEKNAQTYKMIDNLIIMWAKNHFEKFKKK